LILLMLRRKRKPGLKALRWQPIIVLALSIWVYASYDIARAVPVPGAGQLASGVRISY